MAMVIPGVSYTETLLTQTLDDDPVTTPLFIGYTLSDTASGTALQSIRVGSLTQAISLFGQRGTLAYSLRHFFENGGLYCYVLSLGVGKKEPVDRLNALIAELEKPFMLELLLEDDQTGLILVPEMSELNDTLLSADDLDTSVFDASTLWYQGWKALLTLCSHSQHHFALLELPEAQSEAIALSQRSFSTVLRQCGAAWWPRVETSYKNEVSENILLSPLPSVAAVIQRNAYLKGVWKAPANISLEKTLKPTQSPYTSLALLDSNGVSCNLIRSFVGKGVRLWGCRTLLNDSHSPWRYIQTRLLGNSIGYYISKLAKSYLFEPNNVQTWMKLKGQVWVWLRQQWLAGIFFGTVEEDAFSLSIGLNETMTEDDIVSGKMILRVRLALLAPAEFIGIILTLDLNEGITNMQLGGES